MTGKALRSASPASSEPEPGPAILTAIAPDFPPWSRVGASSGASGEEPLTSVPVALTANRASCVPPSRGSAGKASIAPATSNRRGSVYTFIVRSSLLCLMAACATRGATPPLLSFELHKVSANMLGQRRILVIGDRILGHQAQPECLANRIHGVQSQPGPLAAYELTQQSLVDSTQLGEAVSSHRGRLDRLPQLVR